MISDSIDETTFPPKILLTDTQVSSLCNALGNISSSTTRLSKTHQSKIIQLEEFIGRLYCALIKVGLSLQIKVVLMPLGKTAAVSATDAAIQRKVCGSWITTLIISNKEMKDIMKIGKSLKGTGLLLKSVSETIENESKEQKGGFLSML